MSILTRSKESEPAAPAETSGAADRSPVAFTPIAPRARLMPPELAANQRRRAVRRGLVLVVVAVAVLAGGMVGGAYLLGNLATARSQAAAQETQSLQLQMLKLKDVKNTQEWISEGKAAIQVGGSTDVDWADYFTQLQSRLPSDVTLTEVAVQSADAVKPVEQSTVPLEGARIATLTFTAQSTQLPQIPDWITSLSSMKGFADATPSGVTRDQTTGVYTASVTMHINSDAYSHLYAKKVSK